MLVFKGEVFMNKYLLPIVFFICCIILGFYSGLDTLIAVLLIPLIITSAIFLIPIWLLAFILTWKRSGIKEAWKEFNPIAMFNEIINEEIHE